MHSWDEAFIWKQSVLVAVINWITWNVQNVVFGERKKTVTMYCA